MFNPFNYIFDLIFQLFCRLYELIVPEKYWREEHQMWLAILSFILTTVTFVIFFWILTSRIL